MGHVGAPYRTDADDAVATTALIGSCYHSLGLEPRLTRSERSAMPPELLATCWAHAGDAMPLAGRHLSPLDLRARAEAVAAAGFTGIGFTIDDLDAAKDTYGLPQVKQICDDLGLVHLEVELLEHWWTTGSRRRPLGGRAAPAGRAGVRGRDPRGSRTARVLQRRRLPVGRRARRRRRPRRVLCGSGTFDVTGFVQTLERIGFAGPWGVEIISRQHRQRPLQEAMTDAYRTTLAAFGGLPGDGGD